MRKRFLKLVEEHDPKQKLYTVTLTDPYGEVENQFTVTGGDFAFDNFQEFKNEMTGVSEDNELFQKDLERRAEAGDPEATKAIEARKKVFDMKLQQYVQDTSNLEKEETDVV